MSTLARIAATIRQEGGLLAHAVVGDGRAAGGGDYAYLVECIREGYLQHYAQGRVVLPHDPDLALLAGDRLYALGLAKLAEVGDLETTILLADAISACAQAHAEGRPEAAAVVWSRVEQSPKVSDG